MTEKAAKDCSDRRYRDFGGFCIIAGEGWPACHHEDRNGNLKCRMARGEVEETWVKARARRIEEIKRHVKAGTVPPIF